MSSDHADVAIIGAGPSGLAAATELRRLGVGSVVVVDRESEAGGIPRHCFHQGFGLRDLRRVMSGPRYAASRAATAERAGAQILLGTQVTGWTPSGGLELTGPAGRRELSASAVLLATGCRERPRSARLIAGTRPQGVINTGTLQQLVYLEHEPVGSRAVVVGAEHVSFSALMTLRHAGVRAVAMTTEHARHQSFAALRVGAALPHRTRLLTRTAVSAIRGSGRVEAVEVVNLDSGTAERIACDLLVLTADWIPDHELAVLAGAAMDPASLGPLVDVQGHTSRPGLFAAGNILHGAEPADVAALSGRHVASAVREHLAGAAWPAGGVPVRCIAPLRWVVPGRVRDGPGAHGGRYLLRACEELLDVRLRIAQDGRELQSRRLTRVLTGRSTALEGSWERLVDPTGGPVEISVRSARRRR